MTLATALKEKLPVSADSKFWRYHKSSRFLQITNSGHGSVQNRRCIPCCAHLKNNEA